MIKEDAGLSDALDALHSGQPDKAFDLCATQISQDGETAAALLLRSMCYVSMGQSQPAVDDNGKALNMLSLSGNELLAFADESADYGLEPGYCASVMENAGRDLERQSELSSRTLFSAANAYNHAGICRYRAGSPLDLERADFEHGRSLLLQARSKLPFDRDNELMLALVSSNLAECCFRGGSHDQAQRLFEESSAAIEPYIRDDPAYLQQYSFCQSCLYDIERAEENNVEAHNRITRLIRKYESVIHDRGRRDLTAEQRLTLASCYLRRGSVRFQMGDYSGDVSDCTRAVDLLDGQGYDPSQLAQVYFSRAEAYEQQEKLVLAASDYGKSASLLEDSPARDESASIIAMRRFLEACCYERLGENVSAAESYRFAAEAFSMFGIIPDDTSEPPASADREMAALCRYRCGMCLSRGGVKDYHGSFAELTKAYHILEMLDDNMLIIGKKATVANSLGDLYELFDDYERAAAYFSLAEDLLSGLDKDSKKRVMSVTAQMLDPVGGAGLSADTGSGTTHKGVISDDMYSGYYLEDDDDDIDDYFDIDELDDEDEALDEFLASLRFEETASAAAAHTSDEAYGHPSRVTLSFRSPEHTGDESEEGAEHQEEPDDDSEIWKDSADNTPKG